MTAGEHCCEAGRTAWPEDCPWHPPAPLQAHETITACSRCDGSGKRRLRGAERVREVMGWPREEPDQPCSPCRGKGVVVISQAELAERMKPKPKLPHEIALQSHYAATLFSTPPVQLPKDFA